MEERRKGGRGKRRKGVRRKEEERREGREEERSEGIVTTYLCKQRHLLWSIKYVRPSAVNLCSQPG